MNLKQELYVLINFHFLNKHLTYLLKPTYIDLYMHNHSFLFFSFKTYIYEALILILLI